MHRYTLAIGIGTFGVGTVLGVALAARPGGAALPRILPAAFAGGGLVQDGPGRFWTSAPDGNAVYQWDLGGSAPEVTQYDWASGRAVTRLLARPTPAGGEGGAKPVEGATKELDVTGVIWTPDARSRTAIINGTIVREGESVAGRSGKRYKILAIHQDRDVEFQEEPPAGR